VFEFNRTDKKGGHDPFLDGGSVMFTDSSTGVNKSKPIYRGLDFDNIQMPASRSELHPKDNNKVNKQASTDKLFKTKTAD
jgi:hypothetical protein